MARRAGWEPGQRSGGAVMPIKHEIKQINGKTKTVNLTPIKATRLRCIDCSQGSLKEVRLCDSRHCPLWPYRLGKNPCRTGLGNAGHLKKSTIQLKNSK